MSQKKLSAWVISVDMGYGHQRAAYPLKDIAFERIITANSDKVISAQERRWWKRARAFYEFISRVKKIPVIGSLAFGLYDQLQSISPFFPFRDLSKPNFAALRMRQSIRRGLCKSLIQYTEMEKLPIVATHFTPALAYHYAGKECYCVATDTDVNRVWVPVNPKECRITYFSPCRHVTTRLREYGVPEDKIVETGFPLPKENIGPKGATLKRDLFERLVNLDPRGVFFAKYGDLVLQKFRPDKRLKRLTPEAALKYKTHPLTITYLVGGSGAQTDIGVELIASLKARIAAKHVRVILSAGTRLEAKTYFEEELRKLGLQHHLGADIVIVFAFEKREYFAELNSWLRTTDILWTKPSELSFYTALGLPIIIAPPIGAHEHHNRAWLEQIGSGFIQEDPKFVNDWLFYWVNDGRFAEAALRGYLDAPSTGTESIETYLRNKTINSTK